MKDHTRADEPGIDEVAGVDAADVDEAHDPDDSMERAGSSHHTKDELDLPPYSDADPENDPEPGN